MRTRLLESLKQSSYEGKNGVMTEMQGREALLRASVNSVEVAEINDDSLLLNASAVLASKRKISSADSDMMNQQQLALLGQKVAGTIRVDVLSDTVLRVRYAEGEEVPANFTPMVVGTPPVALKCDIIEVGEIVEIRTAKIVAQVSLAPYRIEVFSLDGRKICGVGGGEKDNFNNWDSYNTGICRVIGDGKPLAVENFDLHYDEAIYGWGEKFLKLNKVGQTIDLNMDDALGVTTPRSYKNIPFYVSTRGYGVFFNHSSLMTGWVGSLSTVDVQIAAEDDFLDYYIMVGDIKEIFNSYTDITGKGSLPPKWTFGYWQSKISYSSAEETLEIARKMREHHIPCDVIHLDTFWFKDDWYCDLLFDKERFPDPAAYLAELANLGIKISLWQLPYIPEGSQLYNDLKTVDGFVKTVDGDIYNVGICFTPGFNGTVGVVDYTNPLAVAVHQQAFRALFRLGAKVIKTDFGESAPLDGVYYDGTPGHRMHNLYPLLYNKAIFEVTKEETGDGVVWARSAWAGSQRYPLHWGGDNSPNYFNMEPQLAGGLSFGMSGNQFWSQDIGGFLGNINQPLLIRWMQIGMFLSHSRIHGCGDRELYKFEAETQRICGDYIRLRYRLMPYIYGSARQCVAASLPLARPLVVEYQQDPTVFNIGDEYLFGESLLVAPIFTEENSRRIYLPAGVWTDWWTGERITGGCWITREVDVETMPLYIREGGLIPLGPVMDYVDAIPTEEIELKVALFTGDGHSHFELPINGEIIPLDYRAAAGKHLLTIGETRVKFKVQVFGEGELVVN